MPTIYEYDCETPPRQPETRVVPGLNEGVTIRFKYVDDWKGHEDV
jgi:hypothetical protein